MDLTPRDDPSDASGPAPTGRARRRRIVPMLVLAATVVVGGVIVTQFLGSAVDYFCNVDEVGERAGCETDRRIRLQGTVDAGSLDDSDPGVTRFSMSFGGTSIPVEYDGQPGGIFRECIPVVVHGVIRDDRLEGDQLEVKHSNEYEEANADELAAAEAEADAECPDPAA
ncbi:cytochrome c maturation protein CcmE [Ilumatobacter sp.]|uniref:cytochrome c maturation protein CcmE domain-containing protein n=1 Tax=Ilumatobacter sp. TaxID=1967498 RepID=UPI003B51BF14